MFSGEDLTPIRVRRWPTERPLLYLNALAAAGVWFVLVRSPTSIVFVLAWAAILGAMNLAFVATIRGSAVRLGPKQFPELHARVEALARRMGLRRTPIVYLMQQNGALNAFAMRFARTHMVVLLSDLLEACGDDASAQDMIIGHELGHIRAGHLRARWLLMPTAFVPFLGSALSRAREYTCDRYGYSAAGNRDGALLGLAILSAGGRYGRSVNLPELTAQRRDMRGTAMLIGEWLGSHPPLSKRVWALAPDLERVEGSSRVKLQGMRIAAATAIVLVAGVVAVSAYLPRLGLKRATASTRPVRDPAPQVERDLARLKAFVESERRSGRPLPWDAWDLYARWQVAHPHEAKPVDPFSGYWYDYEHQGEAYRIWSCGPDGQDHTADDIVLESAKGATVHPRYVSRQE